MKKNNFIIFFIKRFMPVVGCVIGSLIFLFETAAATNVPVSNTKPEKPHRMINNITNVLYVRDYLSLVCANHPEFQKILADGASLEARHTGLRDARDLIISAAPYYSIDFPQEKSSSTEKGWRITLEKLFPKTGSTLSVSAAGGPGLDGDNTRKSSLVLSFSQSLVKNAFGKLSRLKDEKAALQTNYLKYQILETYENFLSTLIVFYYDWFESYAVLKHRRGIYKDQLKLFDNLKDKARIGIASDRDINQMRLQILSGRENLLTASNQYSRNLYAIKLITGANETRTLIPEISEFSFNMLSSFEKELTRVTNQSRTFKMMRLTKEKASIQVKESLRELYPQFDFRLNYDAVGAHENVSFFGEKNDFGRELTLALNFKMPLFGKSQKASYTEAQIEKTKTDFNYLSQLIDMKENLKNLYETIRLYGNYLSIGDEKHKLAVLLYEEEKRRYRQGQSSLSDLIRFQNDKDHIYLETLKNRAAYYRHITAWQRMTDTLLKKNVIK